MRVHRFAAGVGLPPIGWMDTLQLEQNVQSVASDVMNYYACMDDWSAAIGDAILLLRNGSLATSNIVAADTTIDVVCTLLFISLQIEDVNFLSVFV